ncbi:MAG: FkbM family methyltransferase [Xenococcaceae cyanobacterium MO_167.B52]|nr:FkbM family methyltransferase [Xenococcaceae cyanobacterium MO_167.B52]
MQFIQNTFLIIYRLFKKTGLLESFWFKKLFLFSYFLYKKYFEDPFFGLIKKSPEIFKGGNILDIGANIGYTSIMFSKARTPGFKVYAFEPDRANLIALKEMIKNRKAKGKIIPIHAALGAKNGTVELWHNEQHHGDHRILTQKYKKSGVDLSKIYVVPMWCIDSFVESEAPNSAVKFIKIDVQGYELPVCLGMQQTLAANPDAVVALEYAPSSMCELGFVPEKVLKLFQDQGYFMYILHKRGRLELAQNKVIDILVKKRGYIDLVFCRKELIASS